MDFAAKGGLQRCLMYLGADEGGWLWWQDIIVIEKENAFKNNNSKEHITKEDAVKERLVKNNTRIVIKNKNQAKSTNRADLQEDVISKKDFTNKFLKNSDVVASNLGKNNNGKTSKINDFDSTFLQKNTNTDIVNVLRNDIDITEKKLNVILALPIFFPLILFRH